MLASKNTMKVLAAISLTLLLSVVMGDNLFADESEQRRVGISMSIFPRIVAVDNHFRDKLDEDNKARLLFVYDSDKEFAQELADRIKKDSGNIGGMYVEASVISVSSTLPESSVPTAIFIAEKLSDVQLKKVMAYAEWENRLLFSPFSGDVERGVMVGISVTNRVKPYFNLPALRRSKVVVNALLMKMSKRYE